MEVGDNRVVAIVYILWNDDEDVLEMRAGQGPLIYLHASENILPGLESALAGRRPGDEVQARVPLAEAYGLRDEMLIPMVPRVLFGDEAIQVGDCYEGYSPDGSTVDVTVVAIENDAVIVDANHPLAGMALNFEAIVMAVRDASPEEIAAGRVLLPLPAIH
jgi:FKBP-type peptidyl-prolyl cis-trans isomerase SlyD